RVDSRVRDCRRCLALCRLFVVLLLLLFSCGADHRHLHSFPTRRSSDLRSRSLRSVATSIASLTGFVLVGRPTTPEAPVEGFVDRSEEHTSELQSRENLVCRLLLEKKKK